ncbi:MarR family winged helix-turn-helix transcriptional regulator [Acidimangrovimonas sediminis]|uniref:MarR family winged helix-turn-helix transcriptional regulator n=1 Tax=Acidimangrovimonas sediminis TaxID=2056283 RepID=UPI000C8009F6|nr:MarR family transcriptional regulator [Acidimangrovimonas sediminis]
MSDSNGTPEAVHLDAEYGLAENPDDHRSELRLWLRMLTCTTLIETEIRKRLREQFDTTLPRFDMMAQLYRTEEGVLLGELSQRMMVSNGNVTGLVERLVQEGLIERQVSETDRRATRVSMTPHGRAVFAEMAEAHAEWISDFMSSVSERDQERLWSRLGGLKASVRGALSDQPAQGRKASRRKRT